MGRWLKQSTTVELAVGPFVDQTDGFTAETALTISQADVRLKKNDGDWAQKNESTSAVHEENGWYRVLLDTTDTNTLGVLVLAVNESGALPVWHEFMVLPANVWDSLFGADKLQVHADEITAGLITAAAIATDAIDADAIADNAITAGAIATDAITSAKIADNTITAAKIATDAITADKVAANTIDASALAADAVAEIADGVWDEALSGHQAAGSAGRNLTLAGSVLGEFTLTGTPTTTVVRLTGGSSVNDFYNDMAVLITSGALTGQIRPILDYDGATGDLTVDEPFTSAPAAGVTVAILAQHVHPVSQIADSIWDEDATGHQTQGTFGQAIGDPGADTDTIYGLANTIAASSAPTAIQNADALLDRVDGVESGLTVRQQMRIAIAALAGISSISGGQRIYRSTDNAKSRITATVSNGDRSVVTLDKS